MQVVIEISKDYYEYIKEMPDAYKTQSFKVIAHGKPLPKGHGDLIDRSKLEVCSIDITDLPTDKGLMVYYAEDVDKAPAIIEADNESEAADL